MRSARVFITLGALAGGLFMLTSCSGTIRVGGGHPPAPSHPPVVVKSGPPPHAPAHGYRRNHGRVVLVYDAHLEVYVVDGHAGYYYCRDRFYRSRGGNWQVSFSWNGPWRTAPDSHLPYKLYQYEIANANGHPHKKVKYKAK